MKLHNETSNIVRQGISTENAFQIKTSVHAFDILSSGIYTDNILAIIRELSCNAYDSHIDAGKADVPFTVHLPSEIEPWFSVKDEGTGLSHEQVTTLYTTYFESTKTNSNDFIGALGLGSKSPFSYSKSFEVISTYNGYRRIYSAFINETGVPAIAQLSKIPTDCPNGIEVKLAVKHKDFSLFFEKAKQVFKWFDNTPKIVGGYRPFPEDIKETPIIEDKNWKLLQNPHYKNDIIAVQGNIGYKVDVDHLVEHVDSNIINLVRNLRLVLMFDIGDLQIAASREEIRYDSQTINTIVNVLNGFVEQLVNIIESKVANIDSKWDKFCELTTILNDIFYSHRSVPDFFDNRSNDPVLSEFARNDGIIKPIYNDNVFSVNAYSTRTVGQNRRTLGVRSIIPTKKTKIFYNDMRVGGVQLATEYIRTNKYDRVIVISPRNHRKDFTESPEFIQAKKELFDSIGCREILTTSSLASTINVKSKSATPIAFYKFCGVNYTGRGVSVEWNRSIKVDTNVDGLWVNIRNGKTLMYGDKPINTWSPTTYQQNFRMMLDAINKKFNTKYKIKNIYGVTTQHIKKVQKTTNWKNLFDLFIECIPDYSESIAYLNYIKTFTENTWFNKLNKPDLFKAAKEYCSPDSVFKQQLDAIEQLIDKQKQLPDTGLLKFINVFDNTYGHKSIKKYIPSKNECIFDEQTLIDTYPMLQLVDLTHAIRYNSDNNLKTIFDYIQQIDNGCK